jgi:hypothetical protein
MLSIEPQLTEFYQPFIASIINSAWIYFVLLKSAIHNRGPSDIFLLFFCSLCPLRPDYGLAVRLRFCVCGVLLLFF